MRTSECYRDLVLKIDQRSTSVAVIGLGYVGLPLATMVARAGFKVSGIERNPSRVASLNAGYSYIEDLTDDDLSQFVENGYISAESGFSSISNAGVISICVPTPLDKNRNPYTSYIEFVVENSVPYMCKGQLLILESTTYPGTTEEIILPKLRDLGFEVGEDIFLAFSPERIDPGNKKLPPSEIPRVVGGVTKNCTKIAQHFYEQILNASVFTVSSPKVAEMTKLFENVFRVVNVSLVNELAQLCQLMNIDVWEVIKSAETKPYGFMPFYPGPGVGGHCIPIDPFFLSWKAKEYGFATQFIDLAGQINERMPLYVVEQISKLLLHQGKLLEESSILLIGVSFKRNVADTRESASVKIGATLLSKGARLIYHDPHVPSVTINNTTFESVPITKEYVSQTDLVIIGTDHSELDYSLVVDHSNLIYDTRNALGNFCASHIHRLGTPDSAI